MMRRWPKREIRPAGYLLFDTPRNIATTDVIDAGESADQLGSHHIRCLCHSKPALDRHVAHSSDTHPGCPAHAHPDMSLAAACRVRAFCNRLNPREEATVPLRETELESEFEDEFEGEEEYEGEGEGEEFDLGGVISGLLGESEYEEEYECEDEDEDDDEGGVISERDGESEDEGEAVANSGRRAYSDAMMEQLVHAAAEAETE